jgi:hypothetical protein
MTLPIGMCAEGRKRHHTDLERRLRPLPAEENGQDPERSDRRAPRQGYPSCFTGDLRRGPA